MAMSTAVNLQPEPADILACTISRDVQNFDLLIDDMELELGESWGDLTFDEIGEQLSISPNTAASRWRYAMEALRRNITARTHD